MITNLISVPPDLPNEEVDPNYLNKLHVKCPFNHHTNLDLIRAKYAKLIDI